MAESESIPDLKNVIIFGETGVGKSSIINMLIGSETAEVNDSAVGCTFEFKCYSHQDYNFYDTVGLSEGSHGLVANKRAFSELVSLLKSLENGVNLLIIVMKQPRITETLEKNYKLFVETICMDKVPVIMVVTHCELMLDMDQWWRENQKYFEDYGMTFSDTICVCATKGENVEPVVVEIMKRKHTQSRENLYRSIETHVLTDGWKMKNWAKWWLVIMKKSWNFLGKIFGFPLIAYWTKMKDYFVKQGHKTSTATELANELHDAFTDIGFSDNVFNEFVNKVRNIQSNYSTIFNENNEASSDEIDDESV